MYVCKNTNAIPGGQLGPQALAQAPHCWHGPTQHLEAVLAQRYSDFVPIPALKPLGMASTGGKHEGLEMPMSCPMAECAP